MSAALAVAVVVLTALVVCLVNRLLAEREAKEAVERVNGVYRCGRCRKLIPLGFAHRAEGGVGCVVADRSAA